MSQTREKWDSLVLTTGDFWMIWRCRSILCFHFDFLFRNNGIRKQLDQKDLHRCFDNFFSKVSFRKLCWKFFLNNYKTPWQGNLKDTLQLKISPTWIDKGIKPAPRHLIDYCVLLSNSNSFSQTNLDFAFNLIWWSNLCHNLFTFLFFDILCILKFIQYPYAFHENQ